MKPKKSEEVSFEQNKLFTAMLNFAYIPFESGIFKITDKQIIEFWKYAKSSVLKGVTIEKYYSLLNLSAPYTLQIPTITEKNSFISDSYKMTVAWINDTSSGKMATAPKAYRQEGLELFNFENEKAGSVYPEYFELYELIDDANEKWKNWTKTERYALLDAIVNLSHNKKIIIPQNLLQAYTYIQ